MQVGNYISGSFKVKIIKTKVVRNHGSFKVKIIMIYLSGITVMKELTATTRAVLDQIRVGSLVLNKIHFWQRLASFPVIIES